MDLAEQLDYQIQEFLDKLKQVNHQDFDLIKKAVDFGKRAHETQTRKKGDLFFNHPIRVATRALDYNLDATPIIACLLHDVIEDTGVTKAQISRRFGRTVADLVDGVSKLTEIEFESKAEQQAESFQKMTLAMSRDIRVVLVKLADRLHNMRTLGYMPDHKRKRIAQETLDIFAPLANRLGIWQIKWELEDLGFRYTKPDRYKEIAHNLDERRPDRDNQVKQIIEQLKTLLAQANIEAEISGRSKHLYSIYQKMLEKNTSFDMVRDLRGVRLIVPDIPSCYSALGIIHTHWRPIPNEFDDYIAVPKDNFYQSLHTAVLYDDGKPLEVQIRTAEMNQNAEYGIAAHWRYKEKGKRDDVYEQRIQWLRQIMDWSHDVLSAQEFVDSMKTDVFQDRVYIFTPKGDIYDLPIDSTPIDFAYHVHTEIGHRCRGAKINGKLVPLEYKLKTGDQVEILTAKQGGPSRDWLNINLGLVATQRARTKIRHWFKRQDREQNCTHGKAILERELHRLGVTNVDFDQLARTFNYKTPDDLFSALGCGDIALGRIVNSLSEEDKDQDPLLVPGPVTSPQQDDNAISVVGLRGILVNFARCCNPVPGDEITGYITRGRGASIHRQDCPNMLRLKDRDRIVSVSWGEPQHTYPVPVEIKAYDRQGLMGDISGVLRDEGINIVDVDMKVNHNLASINLTLEISNITQLSRLLTQIENLPNVVEAHRLRPG